VRLLIFSLPAQEKVCWNVCARARARLPRNFIALKSDDATLASLGTAERAYVRAGAYNRIAVNYVSVGWRMAAESTDLDRVRQLNVGMSETTNLCVCALGRMCVMDWHAGKEIMV
jgi:hypothetical protein